MTTPINAQTVLVTGAGRGLGAAIATAFAREGAQVIINYRNSRTAAEALADRLGARAFAMQADVTDADAVTRMIDSATARFGPITTVVHNALADFSFNGDAREDLTTLTPAHITAQHDTAVLGALHVVQATIPAMKAAGFGRIITIGTNLLQNPVVPYHAYVMSKGSLLGLTRSFGRELGAFGITANMVSGGLLRQTDASAATPEAVFDLIAQSTALGSVTTPAEVADAVLFFASPWSRAVTGQNLIVDGGLVCG